MLMDTAISCEGFPLPDSPTLAYPLTAGAAGPVTTAAGGTSTMVSLALTGAQFSAGATYLGLWSLEQLSTTTGLNGINSEVYNGATKLAGVNTNFKNVSTPQDKRAVLGLFRYQPGASPSAITFDLKITAAASNTCTGQKARVSLLKLGSDDFSTTATGGSQSSTSYSTYATLNFTPATAGDYVLVAFAKASGNQSGATSIVKLVCASQTIEYQAQCPDFGENAFVFILPLTGLSGAQTATIQMRGPNGVATIAISDISIFAIRRDRFAGVYTQALAADAAGTETSYTEAASNTAITLQADHMLITSLGETGSSSSESIYAELVDAGVQIMEDIAEPRGTNATLVGFHDVRNYANAVRKWAIDRKSESGSTSTVLANAAIAVFDLTGTYP